MKPSASVILVVIILLFSGLAALFLHGRQEAGRVDSPVTEQLAAPVALQPPSGDSNLMGTDALPLEGLGVERRPEAQAEAETLVVEALPLTAGVEAPADSEGGPQAPIAEDRPLPPELPPAGETAAEDRAALPEPEPVEPPPPPGPQIVTGVVSRGDTALDILQPFMDRETANLFMRVSQRSHSLADLRAGQPYEVLKAGDGSVEQFVYEIDRRRQLVIEKGNKGLTSRVEPITYDTELALIRGTITSSLFQAFSATGESPNLAVMLADIFASEINFIKDLRKNDSFVILVEKRYRHGEFKHYGRILGARFINRGKQFEAFRQPGDESSRFFNAKGESVQKVLLQSPLAFTRITSNYSLNRKHPVFFDRRPHEGVDYGAPSGTPVKAVGDGQVTKAGWGNGFGNMVILRHTGSLESMYSHLSGFARGIKDGVKVRQGQVIGYVGATGVATGPHLDFRLRQNGKYVNPTKAVNPRAEALAARRLREFEDFANRVRACLDGKRDVSTYNAGKWK